MTPLGYSCSAGQEVDVVEFDVERLQVVSEGSGAK